MITKTTALQTPKPRGVSLTAETYVHRAEETAVANGKRMGTVKVVFDIDFIKENRRKNFLVHWTWAPEKHSWHQIDRENHRLIWIPADDLNRLDALQWHETLCINESALRVARRGLPMCLSVSYYNDILVLHGEYSLGGLIRVAQVDPDHEAASVAPASLLREAERHP